MSEPSGKATSSAKPSLTQQTLLGGIWLVGQTLAIKFIGIGGQLLLAWLLSANDFGQISLAYTVTGFIGVTQQAGIREILVHRHRRVQHWENAAFWISLTFGLVAMTLAIICAPLAKRLYESPSLTSLICILAFAFPLNALATVSLARLQAAMQFRLQSALNISGTIATVLLSCALAYAGWGALSFAIPVPLVAAGKAIALLIVAPPRVQFSLQMRRWRFLLPTSTYSIMTAISITACLQGDYVALGLFHDDATVGIYFLAFSLSTQSLQLVGVNAASVLLPALSKLKKSPERLRDAFLRTIRVSAFIGVPLCALQAVIAEPVFIALFKKEWFAAVRPFELLSLGMMMQLPTIASGSLFQATGRFKELFIVSTAFAALFAVSVLIASYLGGAGAVASAVASYWFVVGPVNALLAMRPIGGNVKNLYAVLAFPIAASVMAGAIAIAVTAPFVSTAKYPVLVAGTRTIVMTCAYMLMSVIFARNERTVVMSLLQRFRGNTSPA